MGGGRGTRRTVPALAVAGAALIMAAAPAAAGDKDVRLVYCLADSRRADLIEAAELLGVAAGVPGDPSRLAVGPRRDEVVAVPKWPVEYSEDFERVCSALMKANSDSATGGDGGGGGDNGMLSGLLLSAAGVGFLLLGQFVERGSVGRRLKVEALAAATSGFSVSGGAYLDAWELNPDTPHDPVGDSRAELAAALRGFGTIGGRRRQARSLAASLPLAEPLSAVRTGEASGPRELTVREKREAAAAQRVLLTGAIAEAESLTASSLVWYGRRVLPWSSGGGSA